jgi:ZIP family zinc transporter
MNELLAVILLALLPAAGSIIGGAAPEFIKISQKTLDLALHATSGIVLAVISIELLPRSLEVGNPFVVVSAFIAGGILYIILDQATNTQNFFGRPIEGAALGIYMGIVIDVFADGLMIGTSSLISLQLGLLLALGQISANIPGSFAAIAKFKDAGVSKRKRYILNFSSLIFVLIGAVGGYLLVKGQPQIVLFAMLSFTAGILLTVTVEEIIPESHREGEARIAALAFIGGFALFALLSGFVT